MEREKFRIPRSVQDAIPIHRIFADGIFQVGNRYSKTWSFTDINYAIAGKEDKTSMFLDYSELLNESGFRTPKEDRIQEIARVLNVCKENFFTRVLSGKLNDVPSGRLFRADSGFLQMCQSL